jgi:hypothetical protein
MLEPIIITDTWLAAIGMPALWRILLWALASGIITMALYARIAPQEKIAGLKQQQKTLRDQLLTFDGNWQEANDLIRKNLKIALRMIGLCILPVLAAGLPVVWVMAGLYERYGEQAIIMIGPSWLQGFDALYILMLLAVSVAIKLLFEIA